MSGAVVPGGPDRRLLANRRPTDDEQYRADIDQVQAALLRQLRNGVDVGAFLVEAVAAAQAHVAQGHSLSDNRPGSWESALLEQMLQAGGSR